MAARRGLQHEWDASKAGGHQKEHGGNLVEPRRQGLVRLAVRERPATPTHSFPITTTSAKARSWWASATPRVCEREGERLVQRGRHLVARRRIAADQPAAVRGDPVRDRTNGGVRGTAQGQGRRAARQLKRSMRPGRVGARRGEATRWRLSEARRERRENDVRDVRPRLLQRPRRDAPARGVMMRFCSLIAALVACGHPSAHPDPKNHTTMPPPIRRSPPRPSFHARPASGTSRSPARGDTLCGPRAPSCQSRRHRRTHFRTRRWRAQAWLSLARTALEAWGTDRCGGGRAPRDRGSRRRLPPEAREGRHRPEAADGERQHRLGRERGQRARADLGPRSAGAALLHSLHARSPASSALGQQPSRRPSGPFSPRGPRRQGLVPASAQRERSGGLGPERDSGETGGRDARWWRCARWKGRHVHSVHANERAAADPPRERALRAVAAAGRRRRSRGGITAAAGGGRGRRPRAAGAGRRSRHDGSCRRLHGRRHTPWRPGHDGSPPS